MPVLSADTIERGPADMVSRRLTQTGPIGQSLDQGQSPGANMAVQFGRDMGKSSKEPTERHKQLPVEFATPTPPPSEFGSIGPTMFRDRAEDGRTTEFGSSFRGSESPQTDIVSSTAVKPGPDAIARMTTFTDNLAIEPNHSTGRETLANPAHEEAQIPAEQVSIRLTQALADGKRSLRMRLHPEELGTVDVRMNWQNGRLTAQFLVERVETLDMLLRDARVIEQALTTVGATVDSDGLSFQLSHRDDSHFGQQGSFRPEPQSIRSEEPEASGVAIADVELFNSDGFISIRV